MFADLRGTVVVIRRLLVTFVAIVMAMAAGIALGGGPLSDIGRTPSQAAAPPAQPTADPQDEARAAYADAFAAGLAPGLYAGRLHGHPVAIVSLPGADPASSSRSRPQVRAAGTQVIGDLRAHAAPWSTRREDTVDTLGLQLVEQLGTDVVTADATTYDRIGQLRRADAVSATKRSAALDAARVASLRASLQGAGLVALPEGEPAFAPLVLVVTGKEVEPPVAATDWSPASRRRGQGRRGGRADGDVGVVGLRAAAAGPTRAPSTAPRRRPAG